METAETVIKDVLQEILVQASEQDIQSVDFQTAKRYMNRMMASFAASGISLGYTKVINPTDPITIPDGAIEGLIFNLAMRLVTSYDIPVAGTLAVSAREGKNAMRKLSITVRPTSMPCTLPIGSGNEGENTFNNNHFYGCPESEVLTEQGGSILLEDGTHES
ncbi:MAG: hypothetical protein JKY89_10970 [Immundisolibacteraceae bacterium]|nr:hypothetical protein [Immundisolibacteraceae bacterium]